MALDVHTPTIRDLLSFNSPLVPTPPSDDRRSVGLDISRPASTSSQASSQYPLRRPSPNSNLQLPGLSQLTNLAQLPSPRASPDGVCYHGPGSPAAFLRPVMNVTPTATVGPGGQPPVCQNCATSTTPLWRRDENGFVLCNACGLFLKLHGKPRPISLKTDVIKSRNRAKANNANSARKRPAGGGLSLPAAHPDTAAAAAAVDAARRASAPHQLASGPPNRSQSPLSRAGTPILGSHSGNIAPQSMFDSVTLDNQAFHPSLRPVTPGAQSPSGSPSSETAQAMLALREQLTGLHTRVNELEVINELFRGRVGELEPALENSRLGEKNTRAELEMANVREAELKRRVEELEAELSDVRGEQRSKRARLSDIVVEDGSQASTPHSCVS